MSIRALLVTILVILVTACSKPAEEKGDARPSGPPAMEPKAAPDGLKCAAHNAPKELCFICDASLREKGRLWCNQHNCYEDRCWECHPEQQDKNRLFCKEHSLYEDECFLCHPELVKPKAEPGDTKPGAAADQDAKPVAARLMCKEHDVPEEECGICHPELLLEKGPGESLKVRLPSPQSAGKAGVTVLAPEAAPMPQGVEAFAELTFNQNRLAQITSPVSGVLKSIETDLGSLVHEGDVLARITSVAIGEAQSAYLKALAEDRLRGKTLERERDLHAQRISAEQDLEEAEAAGQEAEAAVQQSRQHLLTLGFDEQQVKAVTNGKAPEGVLEIRAPFAGEIIERNAVRGAMAETGKPLFTLADTGTLWATLNLPEAQLARIQVGQPVELSVESLPDKTFIGRLTWIDPKVDERTRMARARAEVENRERGLRSQMFAGARILTANADRANAVIVPQTAVQSVAGTPVVFVQVADDLFEVRPVQLGGKQDGKVEVVSGLRETDRVAVTSAFTLKSQFLISRLGAGCTD